MSEQLDLSEYTSASWAAKAAGDRLKTLADELGQDPELEVTVKKNSGKWLVSWPGGPFEWSIRLTGGEALYGTEPEITGFMDTSGFSAECKNGTTLIFRDS